MTNKFTNWVKKGAPLPGATYPPKGTTYLRGRLVPSYKQGGMVKDTGLALLHKGERVLNKKQTKSYSAKMARKGADIGKPGKNFAKIAASAGAKYGSKQAGERVAGAILANLRKKFKK